MMEYREASCIESGAIFVGIEAGMKEGLTLECSNGLAMSRTGGEHQRCARPGHRLEAGEHPALVVRGEVEEAVPGDYAVVAAGKRDITHIADPPFVSGQPRPAHRYHRG